MGVLRRGSHGGGGVRELGGGDVDVGVMMEEEPFSSNILILTAVHPLQVSVKTSGGQNPGEQNRLTLDE